MEEGSLTFGKRGHLYDIEVFSKPNVLKRVATYNSKTDKITFYNASESDYIHYGIRQFVFDRKHKVGEVE